VRENVGKRFEKRLEKYKEALSMRRQSLFADIAEAVEMKSRLGSSADSCSAVKIDNDVILYHSDREKLLVRFSGNFVFLCPSKFNAEIPAQWVFESYEMCETKCLYQGMPEKVLNRRTKLLNQDEFVSGILKMANGIDFESDETVH
jgi:hypothetical protein